MRLLKQMKVEKLNLLPIEILVLQQYLSVKDVSNLNIAICDVDSRLSFLNSLQSLKIRDYNVSLGLEETWEITL
jgi:hypothetical protein